MKLKDVLDIISNSTPILLYLKIGGVWLHRSESSFWDSPSKFKKFYDFKVTKLDTDTLSFSHEGVLVIYAEES